MGACGEANFQRLGLLIIPLLFFIARGITYSISLFEQYKNKATIGMLIIYTFNGVFFANYYFSGFNEMMERVWTDGTQEVIEYANAYNDADKHISDIAYSQVLWFTKYPTTDFVRTVEYEYDENGSRKLKRFENYIFDDYTDEEPIKGDIYICSTDNGVTMNWFMEHDMDYAQFGKCFLGIAK